MALGWKTAIVFLLMVLVIVLKVKARRREFVRFRNAHVARRRRISVS